MATNVSERDKKVLRELIEWLGKERDYVLQWRWNSVTSQLRTWRPAES